MNPKPYPVNPIKPTEDTFRNFTLEDAVWIAKLNPETVPADPASSEEYIHSGHLDAVVFSHLSPAAIEPFLKYRFRVLDDGLVYAEGKSSCNSSFAPLDSFFTPHYGCTTIEYWEGGKWAIL